MTAVVGSMMSRRQKLSQGRVIVSVAPAPWASECQVARRSAECRDRAAWRAAVSGLRSVRAVVRAWSRGRAAERMVRSLGKLRIG